LSLSLFVSPFSVYSGIMNCMHIIMGYKLCWTFLSGSLPVSCYLIYIATAHLCLIYVGDILYC